MKQPKTIAGRLARWAALPILGLAAAVFVWTAAWNLSFPSDSSRVRIGTELGPSSLRTDDAQLDQELYFLLARARSRRNVLCVKLAVNDAGEILFRSHIGYAVFLAGHAGPSDQPDRFLVLDALPMEALSELPEHCCRVQATGRDEGFYFYADSLEISEDNGEPVFLWQPE